MQKIPINDSSYDRMQEPTLILNGVLIYQACANIVALLTLLTVLIGLELTLTEE